MALPEFARSIGPSARRTTVQNDPYLEATYDSGFPSRRSRPPTWRGLFRGASLDKLRLCYGAEMGAESGPNLLFRYGGPCVRPTRSSPALAISALRSDLPLGFPGGHVYKTHRFQRGDANVDEIW